MCSLCFAGAGVCSLQEGDRENGAGDPRHVSGEGFPGNVPERGLRVHRGPQDGGRTGQGKVKVKSDVGQG